MSGEGDQFMPKTILEYNTVSLDEKNSALVIVDQTQLPGRIEMLSLTEVEDIWEALEGQRGAGNRCGCSHRSICGGKKC